MIKKLGKLRIPFPKGWKDISADNPDGPPTFIDEKIEESGVLQISTAEYAGGDIPNPGFADLISLSRNIGLKNEFGDLQKEESGPCAYGIYGSAQFSRPDFRHISVWHLSDGKSFVFVTFISTNIPDQQHIAEVKQVVTSIKKNSFWNALFN